MLAPVSPFQGFIPLERGQNFPLLAYDICFRNTHENCDKLYVTRKERFKACLRAERLKSRKSTALECEIRTTRSDNSLPVCPILRQAERTKNRRRLGGGQTVSTAATDYPYSSSGKTREREINVPLINSVKLSDRRIKRSAQVRSVKKSVGDRISVGYSWRAMFRVMEYVTISYSACRYSVTSVSWKIFIIYETTIKKFLCYC
ncbi:hypothetical protein ALC57_06930 [Trachymyrmex cornetzi]|uniref:Uncharacterized protein n=1 Tax=Trachymyrmex cornetzi TaxID=471704 RepID=A0A195E870_9HYME|nr:hypothetical protein ALC57_06930 [Trachymyrmex cornetzi]